MMPMLRLLRHGDGTLARFHGMGAGAPDLVATLLAYDEARGPAASRATYGGYERLEVGPALVILDAGGPPPPAFATEAHASALAFEFSVGPRHLVVNCGTPVGPAESARELTRRTVAQSTLTIDDASSGVFAPGDGRDARAVLVSGAVPVMLERRDTADGGVRVTLAQDFYRARFGLTHQRTLLLEAGGQQLSGEDRLDGEAAPTAGTTAILRFHLHPDVRASRIAGGRAALLVLPDGEAWEFTTNAPDLAIEESAFFATPDGLRKCQQIVLAFAAEPGVRAARRFARLGRTGQARP